VQNVSTEINATDHAVIRSSFDKNLLVGTSSLLSSDLFNFTNFEYIMGTGVSSVERRDYQETAILEQYPRLFDYGIAWPVSSMVGFAVAGHNGTVEDLSSPAALQEVFDKAHKLLFSTAISTLTKVAVSNTSTQAQEGLLVDQPSAIIFVRPFAIVVEISLCLVCLLTAAFLYISNRRLSKMISDPIASIADVMPLVRDSKELSHLLEDDGTITMKILEMKLRHQRFFLEWPETSKGPAILLKSQQGTPTTNLKNLPGGDVCPAGNEKPKAVRPLELRLVVGFVLMAFIAGAICLLGVFYFNSTHANGETISFKGIYVIAADQIQALRDHRQILCSSHSWKTPFLLHLQVFWNPYGLC
jgi:hypothetical protein